MQAQLSFARAHWPILCFLVSASLLAGAHAFEKIGGLYPCALCLDQREVHWIMLGVAIIGFGVARVRSGWSRIVAGVLGVVFFASAWMAGYHVAVEQGWLIHQCEASGDLSSITLLDDASDVSAPACDEIAWSLFGVSMAGWNMLISAAFGLASFGVALAPEKKSL